MIFYLISSRVVFLNDTENQLNGIENPGQFSLVFEKWNRTNAGFQHTPINYTDFPSPHPKSTPPTLMTDNLHQSLHRTVQVPQHVHKRLHNIHSRIQPDANAKSPDARIKPWTGLVTHTQSVSLQQHHVNTISPTMLLLSANQPMLGGSTYGCVTVGLLAVGGGRAARAVKMDVLPSTADPVPDASLPRLVRDRSTGPAWTTTHSHRCHYRLSHLLATKKKRCTNRLTLIPKAVQNNDFCNLANSFWWCNTNTSRNLKCLRNNHRKPSCQQGRLIVPTISEGQHPTSGHREKAITLT